ncbi:MAG: acyltransferase [Oscillospiraceae bacterium]|jgi:peptidoglycan/LPS O-acetylase OafA/YrhL|nr:acyltransferase [Oscillospiraceae bacterium]
MNRINKPARNNGLDLLKLICAFLVLLSHVYVKKLSGDIYTNFIFIIRIAVPIFFIITGYFYSYTVSKKTEIKQIIKILKLVITANVLYVVWGIVYRYFTDVSMRKFVFDKLLNRETIVDFLFFNAVPDAGNHLWYLSALLYALVIVWLLNKLFKLLKNDKVKTGLIITGAIVLLAVNFCMDEFSEMIGISLKLMYSRNFLFAGLPLFLIGVLLFKAKDYLNKIPSFILVVLLFLSFFVGVGEFYYTGNRDLFISTVVLAVVLFIIFNKIEIEDNVFSKWGSNHSLNIYVIHPMLILIYRDIVKSLGIAEILFFFAPFIIFAFSLAISIAFEFIKKKIKLNFRKKTS